MAPTCQDYNITDDHDAAAHTRPHQVPRSANGAMTTAYGEPPGSSSSGGAQHGGASDYPARPQCRITHFNEARATTAPPLFMKSHIVYLICLGVSEAFSRGGTNERVEDLK